MRSRTRRKAIWSGAAVLGLTLVGGGPIGRAGAASAPISCESLAGLSLPDVRITSAKPVEVQPAFRPEPGAPPAPVKAPFCRVQGVIEAEIRFELWLPAAGAWNGKFLGAGVGGDAGTFNFADLPRGVARGYAAATTDTGHRADDETWMLGDPIRLKNFELRANHLLAEKAKAIVAAYYARAVAKSYFIGCSGGGRQGLKEAQRFPADYDGIIAGAPGPDTPEMTVRRMWEIILRDDNKGLMSPADWALLADAGVQSCDAADGVVDGVAEDPRKCRFDPADLQCREGQTAGCLNAKQVALARTIYGPLHDETGRKLDDGLLPGVLVDSGRSRLAPRTFGQAIRRQTNWNGEGFKPGADLAALKRAMPDLQADDPNLSAFEARGGKLILYHGWIDPAVAARMVVSYYDRVEKAAGGARAARAFTRLFMAPGMLHCGRGPGPDRFGGTGADAPIVDARHDLLSALEAWVEHGQAPDRIVASKLAAGGGVVRTRPLCAYPMTARYKGAGSTDAAENFVCK